MPPVLLASLTVPDWAMIGLYFAMLAATGYLFSRKEQRDTTDYFLAGRRMPVWAVAVSIVATSMSAVSFIGVPGGSYTGNLTYLATNLGMILAAIVVATVFIPAFYREGVGSIYALLHTRFGPRAMQAASLAFLVGRVFASGARIFAGAIPVSFVIFGVDGAMEVQNLLAAIAVMTAVGIGYTFVGGIASVIWTDVIQMAVLLSAAAIAIGIIVARIDAPFGEVWQALSTGGPEGGSKLQLLDLSLDPTAPFGLAAAIIGFTFMGIGSYGTDQDLVQRMLTCKDSSRGARSVIFGILLGIPSVAVFLVVGLLLWVFYQRPDLIGAAPSEAPAGDRDVFLSFILMELPPGVPGLMLAGLFAAGLSSLNSAINAMSSAAINDFYLRWRPGRPDRHYVMVGRLFVLAFGLLLGLFAAVCVFWQSRDAETGGTLLTFALSVMTFAYSGLIGVFFTALLTRRGTSASVIAALIAGFLIILLLQPAFWKDEIAALDAGAEIGGVGSAIAWLASIAFAWKLTLASGVCFVIAAAPKGGHRP
ncbi:MAG: sodium:solute symporter [Phycisphaerales bacterium]